MNEKGTKQKPQQRMKNGYQFSTGGQDNDSILRYIINKNNPGRGIVRIDKKKNRKYSWTERRRQSCSSYGIKRYFTTNFAMSAIANRNYYAQTNNSSLILVATYW